MAVKTCQHGFASRHPDYEWYVYCPGGSLWWNQWHRIARYLPVPDKWKGVVRYDRAERLNTRPRISLGTMLSARRRD